MKELGEKLCELRKANGVTLEEASHDLGVTKIELESVENGNAKIFKDVYELKKIVKSYAKYLGLDEEIISDEFNDFLFEKTSKISLKDIKEMENEENENNDKDRVMSPYTKELDRKKSIAPIVLSIAAIILFALLLYVVLKFVKNDDYTGRELKGKEVIINELA